MSGVSVCSLQAWDGDVPPWSKKTPGGCARSSKRSISFQILPATCITVLIGWLVGRKNHHANSYLNASRSLPLPVVVAAYLAARSVGLSAMAAQYDVQAFDRSASCRLGGPKPQRTAKSLRLPTAAVVWIFTR